MPRLASAKSPTLRQQVAGDLRTPQEHIHIPPAFALASSAQQGPHVGRQIDLVGGRQVLSERTRILTGAFQDNALGSGRYNPQGKSGGPALLEPSLKVPGNAQNWNSGFSVIPKPTITNSFPAIVGRATGTNVSLIRTVLILRRCWNLITPIAVVQGLSALTAHEWRCISYFAGDPPPL